jgi:hypothetical protein
MNYEALITGNVRKIFNLVGNLAKDAVLTKKEDVNFNFGTGKVTAKTSTISTKIIITDVEKSSNKVLSKKQVGLLKTAEVGDLSLYSTIDTQNKIFKIGPIIRTDRFVTIVEIYE